MLDTLQEAMATAQKEGAKGAEEPIMPPIMEPSAEDPSAKKSKKRKVAEAQALEAQAAEADASTPAGMFPLRLHPSLLAVCQNCGIHLQMRSLEPEPYMINL